MKQAIHLRDDDTLDLILPDGRVINIEYSNLEPGNQLPELDIMLPCDMVANCYTDHLQPAPILGNVDLSINGHIRLVRQIIIPMEKQWTTKSSKKLHPHH